MERTKALETKKVLGMAKNNEKDATEKIAEEFLDVSTAMVAVVKVIASKMSVSQDVASRIVSAMIVSTKIEDISLAIMAVDSPEDTKEVLKKVLGSLAPKGL